VEVGCPTSVTLSKKRAKNAELELSTPVHDVQNWHGMDRFLSSLPSAIHFIFPLVYIQMTYTYNIADMTESTAAEMTIKSGESSSPGL
jgi:hypothetical protein